MLNGQRLNEWINEWPNEWINIRMIEWMNQWINEWMIVKINRLKDCGNSEPKILKSWLTPPSFVRSTSYICRYKISEVAEKLFSSFSNASGVVAFNLYGYTKTNIRRQTDRRIVCVCVCECVGVCVWVWEIESRVASSILVSFIIEKKLISFRMTFEYTYKL